MDIFQVIILGIVQGITELLPISSSAHLLLWPKFFGWKEMGLSFDAALHLGTFLAVFIYFRKDLFLYLKGFLNTLKQKNIKTFDEKMAWYIAFSSIPAVFAGLILRPLAETAFRNPAVTIFTLVIGAVVLWFADNYAKSQKILEKISFKNSLMIGVSQILALIPGVSRSGITISFGRLVGLSRDAAAKFSFLLSVPITFGAALFELRKVNLSELGIFFALGIFSAAIFGFLSIKYLLKYVQNNNYNIFVYYRIFLAILVFIFIIN